MAEFKKNWKMVPKWLRIVVYSVLGALGVAAIGILFGFVIMWLWNWLMPDLFGLKTITYWQGVALFALAKILFGAVDGNKGDSQRARDKRAHRFGPHKGDECKAEPDGVKDYDEWWEKEGKGAFDNFINNRSPSENTDGAGTAE